MALINASSAYAAGATGQGVTIGIVDTGVDLQHTQLDANIDPRSRDIVTSRNSVDDTDGHGTLVAGIIAAERDNIATHGVAPQARILAIRTDTPDSCGAPGTDDDCSFSSVNLTAAVDFAIASNVRIINLSLGGPPPTSFAFLGALRRAANAGIIVVAAAGNESGTSPLSPATFAVDPTSLGLALAVGSVDLNRVISTFSNQAGPNNRTNFVVAPGEGVTGPFPDNRLATGSGTSFAAPHVVGALALILSAFPNLTPRQAVQLLVQTTDDLGAPGPDNVYGQGLINLARAFQPVGTLSVNFGLIEALPPGDPASAGQGAGGAGSSSDPTGAPGRAAGLIALLAPASGAFGDWVEQSKLLDGLLFRDAFDRGFKAETLRSPNLGNSRALALLDSLNAFESVTYQGASFPHLTFRTRHVDAPLGLNNAAAYLTQSQKADDFEIRSQLGPVEIVAARGFATYFNSDTSIPSSLGVSPFASQADFGISNDFSFGLAVQQKNWRFGYQLSQSDRGAAQSVAIARALGQQRLTVDFGHVNERQSILGGNLVGRFGGKDASQSNYVGFGWNGPLFAQISGAIRAEISETTLSSPLLTVERNPLASRWAVGLIRPVGEGLLGLTLSQPRRVEAGSISLAVPVAVGAGNSTLYERRRASLTPSGRETDFEMAWHGSLFGGYASLGVRHALNPNNVAIAPSETIVWSRLQWRY